MRLRTRYKITNLMYKYGDPKMILVRVVSVVRGASVVGVVGVGPAAVARAAVDSGVARNPYPAHDPLRSMDDII